MSLLNENELNDVATHISDAEKNTDAELVCVLARQADTYYYIPTLWAALIAMISLPLFIWYSPLWLDMNELLIVQWGIFVIVALLLRIPYIKLLMVPKSVKRRRASNLARHQFLEQNLHCTKQQLGVLIFVSEAERYVEILVDAGIRAKIDDDQWKASIDQMVSQIKAGEVEMGFKNCIGDVGDLLSEFFPATGDKNELENRLVII